MKGVVVVVVVVSGRQPAPHRSEVVKTPRSVRCLWIIASRDKMKLSADLHRFLPASSAV